MTILEIILIALGIWLILFVCAVFTFYILKTKAKFKQDVARGHRELWIFYHQQYEDLKDIFDKATKREELTEKQYIFLSMLFNHMEMCYKFKQYDMLPRDLSLKDDFKDIMSYPLIKKYWIQTNQFRDRGLVEYINKIIKN